VLGYRGETFLHDRFPCETFIATENGSRGTKGHVLDVLQSMDIMEGTRLYACGPKPMLKVLAAYAKERGLSLQISMEERMGCGYGACVGCVCKTTGGNRKVCEDGPVFDANEVTFE
jgi:dihydroorotate dehydrogenase electron transfer subunit